MTFCCHGGTPRDTRAVPRRVWAVTAQAALT